MKKIFLILISIIAILAVFYFKSTKVNNQNLKDKKAIIIGATSGMGRQIAKLLAKDGCLVGLVGRRTNLLETLQKEISTKTYVKQIDITKQDATKKLNELIEQMQGMDLIVISVTSAREIGSKETDYKAKKKIMDVDLMGFWEVANAATDYFE